MKNIFEISISQYIEITTAAAAAAETAKAWAPPSQ
jgi:hypothetical protein